MIVELELKDLTIPQGLLPRVLTGTVEERVEEYTEMLEQGVEFDPISVWKRDNQYWVIDGVHRLEAHKRAGKTTIKAKLVECQNELDYRIKAIQANLKHGLALAKEEKPILAQILYKEGLSEDEIQKVFGVSKSTVYAWLQNIKEEERQEKTRKALELRKRGFTQEQIAKELGVAKSTISTWLQEVQKFQTLENLNILDPQVGNITQEGYKALSELIKRLGVTGKPELPICEEVLKELGFPTEQAKDLLTAFSHLVEATKNHILKLPAEADETLARKWVHSMPELLRLEPQARRIWLERSIEWWKKERERRIKERDKEEKILQIAKKIIQHPEFLFSSWRNLAVDMKLRNSWWGLTKEEESILNTTQQPDIEDILRRHADELYTLYTSIPEATEELIDGLIDIWDRELPYDEFVEEIRRRGYRVPLSSGLYNYYRSLLEKRGTPSVLPSSPSLAGSPPALSEEEEDTWVKGWEESFEEEEKVKKTEKKEPTENPIIKDYEQMVEELWDLVYVFIKKHGISRLLEVLDEIRETLEKEGRDGALKEYWHVW